MLKKLWETFEWHSLPKNINNAWTEREKSVPSGALGTLICIRCLPKFISERLLSVQRIIRWVKYGWINPFWGFPGGSDGKESALNAGDLGSIPGSGRSPGEGNGKSLQYSCLENPMDRGAWRATVHGVLKSQTWLSYFTFTFKPFFLNLHVCLK